MNPPQVYSSLNLAQESRIQTCIGQSEVDSVVSDSLRPRGLWPTRLLRAWDSPGKNTEVGCHFLLQGIFPTQGSNPGLLHWQAGSLLSEPLGKPTPSRSIPEVRKPILCSDSQFFFFFFLNFT